MKLLFFDLETTGVKFWRNGIHQIGGIVDIDGQEAERFDIRLAPNPAATIEQEALDVAGVTLEQVQSYQPQENINKTPVVNREGDVELSAVVGAVKRQNVLV